MALNGSETLQVLGQDANGAPAAGTEQTTTQAIANLARASGFTAVTALNTVGAGAPTAAGIVGGITVRGGSQSNTAFTDTLPLGTLLEAGLTNPQAGQSWVWRYENTTNANATIASATGATVSGITTAFAGSTTEYLVTRTAANTYTFVGVLQTAPTGSSGTFVLNGTTAVTVADTRVTANSSINVTLKTVGGTVGALPSIKTITAGTGFTISGTAADTSTYNYLVLG